MVNRPNTATDTFRFQQTDSLPERNYSTPVSTPEPLNQQPVRSQKRSSLVQNFLNLPIGRKQLIALFICELVPILGLGIGTTIVLTNSLKNQLFAQSKSEVALIATNYTIKIDQMGLSGHSQANSAAIVNAAKSQTNDASLSSDSREQVKQLLQQEASTLKIEYATLVDRNLRIVASANAERQGEPFDPNGLVSEVLKQQNQIKASAIAPWSELEKESPVLPAGFKNEDALIRYVVTPVKDPNNQEMVGALVFGEVVNNKLALVETAQNTLGGGYSAIYLRQPDGRFIVASAADKGTSTGNITYRNIPLSNTMLLQTAAAQKGTPAVGQMMVNGVSYTIAAQSVPNKVVETGDGAFPAFSTQPTAVVVRGTPASNLNNLLRASLLQEGAVLSLGVLMVLVWSAIFRRTVIAPLKQLEYATQCFAQGDRTARAEVYSSDEVGKLSAVFNHMADNTVSYEQTLALEVESQHQQAQEIKRMNEIVVSLRRSLNADDIAYTAVTEIREFMNVERALIYRFSEDYKSGTIVAESVAPGWTKALGQVIQDPMVDGAIDRFSNGRVAFINNLDAEKLSHCHCEILQKLEVKANIIAPIMYGDKLLGLLGVHQCSGPREWRSSEIDFMKQLAAQVSYALDQASLLEQQEEASKRTRQLYDITLNMQKSLEQQEILNIVVREVREALAVERAVVYWFDDRWHGTFISESVSRGYPVALGSSLYDPCFADRYVEKYRQGRVQATPDIHHAGLTPCHLSQLEPYEVKANLVAPILANQTLLGLLIVHQCSAPREWLDSEIDFMRQLAVQLGLTLDRALLFEAKEQSRLAAEALSTEQRQQKEGLQQQLVSLLGDVEDAAMGDLTVRADVTAGDIGTVADFFNSIVESLRQIVTQVQASAEAVTQAVGSNETEIQGLAQQALQQAQEITRTLDSVGAMTHSIETVAARARQAAVIAHQASSTAEAGGNAMDLTVDNILELRATIGETAKKVKRLGESSQQISKVVSLINQIALQTNLLAINAGIEAARAGEEGQGFAVVAEEVGELAARSAAATREIEHLVEAIQRETSEVVEAMEQGTAQVVQGTHLVENAKHSLSQMQAVTHEIDALVQSISESTVSQVDTAQTIRQLMQAVAAVAERTSLSSRQVSDSLRQTVEVTQELQASVGTFKVG